MDTIGNFGIAQVEDDMEQQVYDARGNGDGKTANTITGDHANRVTDFTPLCVQQNQVGEVRVSPVGATLNTNSNASGRNAPLVASFMGGQGAKAGGIGYEENVSSTIKSAPCGGNQGRTLHLSVRRLMPIECERLFGFPDNWTKIPWRGKPADECPDAPRYKACGNSMGVNCMRWIGLGIEAVEDGIRQKQQTSKRSKK